MLLRDTRVRKLLLLLCSVALGAMAWQLTAWIVSSVRGVDFPSPLATLRHLCGLLAGVGLFDHSVYRHVADSLWRWLFGFVIAVAGGVGYGLLAGHSNALGRLTLPLVHALQLIPGLAWIPVALLLFGLGEQSTVCIIALTTFPAIAISVVAGVRQVDATYVRAARMLGAGKKALFIRVLVPGSVPHILSGLRIGAGNAWRVLLAAEMVVGSGTGLGYSIIQARWTLDYASAFACLLVIVVIGLAFEVLVLRRVEKWTLERWQLLEEHRRT